MNERKRIAIFLLSLAVLAYSFGYATVSFDWFPSGLLTRSWKDVTDFAKHWKNDLAIEPTRYLVPAHPARSEGVAVEADRAAHGLRVLAGYFDNRAARNGAVLLDRQGKELFFWPIDPDAIAEAAGAAGQSRHAFVHGFEVLRDGSIVVNFERGAVLGRLGACGEVMWAISGDYHHAVNLADDGSLWTTGSPDDQSAELSDVERMTSIARIDPDNGSVLWTTSIAKNFLENPSKGIFSITRRDKRRPWQRSRWPGDPFHLNDIERLPEDMAAAFPSFEAGDLMLSFRSLNLVVVLDREAQRVKWWQHGPWDRQHDPDFLPSGKISIFDNNMNGTASRILEIDPVTRGIEVVFEGTPESPFFTWMRGKHQRLPNGNTFVTESEAGRVFEIDSRGDIVWEYQNQYDERRNLVVTNAIWLPEDFFGSEIPKCRSVGSNNDAG